MHESIRALVKHIFKFLLITKIFLAILSSELIKATTSTSVRISTSTTTLSSFFQLSVSPVIRIAHTSELPKNQSYHTPKSSKSGTWFTYLLFIIINKQWTKLCLQSPRVRLLLLLLLLLLQLLLRRTTSTSTIQSPAPHRASKLLVNNQSQLLPTSETKSINI